MAHIQEVRPNRVFMDAEPWVANCAAAAFTQDELEWHNFMEYNWDRKRWIPPWRDAGRDPLCQGWLPPKWEKDTSRIRYVTVIPGEYMKQLIKAAFEWVEMKVFRAMKVLSKHVWSMCQDWLGTCLDKILLCAEEMIAAGVVATHVAVPPVSCTGD